MKAKENLMYVLLCLGIVFILWMVLSYGRITYQVYQLESDMEIQIIDTIVHNNLTKEEKIVIIDNACESARKSNGYVTDDIEKCKINFYKKFIIGGNNIWMK